MLLFFLLAIVLVSFHGACALSTPKWARQGSNGLGVRQFLESIETGVNMAPDAALVPVSISEDKQSYFALISMGNMSFRVALDTGSADLWVVSSQCTASTCTSVPRYQLGYASSTFESVNSNTSAFNVSYLDTTTASGFVARETVYLANLTVANQAFALATSSNVTLTDNISGVLGLGFPRLSSIFGTVANATPFFSTMAQLGQLDYPLFGLSLAENESGTLAFGAIDGSIVQNRSLIEWNDVVPFAPFANTTSNTTSYLQWTIVLSQFSIGASGFTPIPTYPNATYNSSLAVLDVGTPGIYGPYQDVARLFSLIPGSRLMDQRGQWAIPCGANTTMSFKFGGQNFTLQPTDYLIGPIDEDTAICLSWPMAAPPSSDGIDWQLGTPFMRTVYTIFSYGIDTKEPPMIGLYPLNNASAPIELPAAISSYFSSASATIATTLPNSVLSTPTYSTPTYAFNTSFPAPAGLIVSSGLGASTYSAVLGSGAINLTAIPTVTPVPTAYTYVVTNPSGQVSTSVSTVSQPSVTLGEPPGWKNSAQGPRVSLCVVLPSIFASLFFILF
ncbi:acid protease [Amylocystis lapponica]|nr:acid protease [Amylocystis lapponica]